MPMNEEMRRRYPPLEEIHWPTPDPNRATTEPEAWWEYPGMFWRWSSGPIRRLAARLRA